MRGTQIGLNGQNFFYRSWGPADGPVILMLHGFPEYSGAGEERAAKLPHHHSIAHDQRGYGQIWAPTAVAE
ncbi:MAG: alpha/beta fold hydrolase, partial [Lutimaribacter sp.]